MSLITLVCRPRLTLLVLHTGFFPHQFARYSLVGRGPNHSTRIGCQTSPNSGLPFSSTTQSRSHQKSTAKYHKMAMSTSASAIPAEEQARLVEESKRLAAHQAVKDHLIPEYTRIGIGSGSTVVYVVEAIAALGPGVTAKMAFYPTGAQSEELIEAASLNLQYINKLPAGEQLDVAFDGADEVDDDLNLIKGGGACLWQEKIVAASAKKFVCVADFRKLSPRLGTNWKKGIPIEVLPMAAPRVLHELKQMGSHNPRIRPGLPGKAGAIVTDNGMWIIDAPFSPLLLPRDGESGIQAGNGENGVWTVDALADRLIKIPGVAEIGLFYGKNGLEVSTGAQKPVAAYFGMADGSIQLKEPTAS
ncbi:ribose 5-phosphate isomerase A-domain-containing protein [Diplogelasinospora grovesii]|uniref:Ribose-5-phosphate isomerase n=1 Tax=Diplogelasinospora grovesii TaxID=303347 RepID=A0AAN6S817_9PEZI|nr:ribose 5-phosphate isomerase A-domain-containing protein [Diplogelasinospora grovesii]